MFEAETYFHERRSGDQWVYIREAAHARNRRTPGPDTVQLLRLAGRDVSPGLL